MDATWDLGASLLQLCGPVTGQGVQPAFCISTKTERAGPGISWPKDEPTSGARLMAA